MLSRCRHTAAAGRGDGQRHDCASAEHVLHLRGLVEDLIHRDADEIHEHQVADRAQATSCGSDAKTDDRLLGNRGVLDTLIAELGQESVEHMEDTAVAGDILTDQEDIGISSHRLVHALIEGLDVRQFAGSHRNSFVAQTV